MFSSRQRAIYTFTVGDRKRYADPLRCLRLLTESLGGSPNSVLEKARDKKLLAEDRLTYQGKLIYAVRSSFNLEQLDGETGKGVTDEECLGLLRDFLVWINSKKGKAGSGPTSYQPSGSPLTSGLITSPSSDSISTWNEPVSGPVGIWPEEPESGEA